MTTRLTVHRSLAGVLIVATVMTTTMLATAPQDPCGGAAHLATSSTPAKDLPVLQVHGYRMAGRIRPLLFWIGRDNVGTGRIVWRGGDGSTAYELLIGTDPARAPRAINRWGYITEDARPAGTRVFGAMTTSEEVTLKDVNRSMGEGQPRGRFKAIDALITGNRACATTGTIETERDLTIHDVDTLVRQVHDRLAGVTPRDAALPAGVRPGFLSAVAELMGGTIAARRNGTDALRRTKGRTVSYVYGRNLLDLTLTGVDPDPPDASGAPAHVIAPVHATFEARARVTGERYRFELAYAGDGPMSGVPVLIRYQPRWWLQVELVLDESYASR